MLLNWKNPEIWEAPSGGQAKMVGIQFSKATLTNNLATLKILEEARHGGACL